MKPKLVLACIIILSLIFAAPLALAEEGELSDPVQEFLEELEEEEETEANNEVVEDAELDPAEEGPVEEPAEDVPLVSTVFFEHDIRDALNEVALQTGVNIIYDETVVGTVTLDLEDVPLERALDMMLIRGGYTYKQVEDYYLVGAAKPGTVMYEELTETETIRLNYISASTAVALLPPFYEEFVRTSAAQENMLTITAPPAVIENFKADLEQVDGAPQEVEIEAIITEISTEVLKERGSDLFGLTTEEHEDIITFQYDGVFSLNIAGPAGQILSRLRALEEEGKAEIQANPSIRVSDRETAELFVGEERVLIMERDDNDDVIEDVEVGVALEVTPQIMAENEVRLEIAPNVSHFTDERADRLVVRRSELKSVLRAESNETITMAGMTLDEVLEYESKVPLLGNIPLLRWLFREEVEKESERELLILITPRIIDR